MTDDDGYIRLSRRALGQIRLVHLVSGLDPEADSTGAGAVHTDISGYTEWATTSVPAVSIGWDWHIDTLARPLSAACRDAPRSNVMLVDEQGRDIGAQHTARCLKQLVDALEWKPVVLDAIGFR
ncbi:DUF4902 domain-containing protein [Stenotrophomonas sp. Y6]|uniref:DUF4902 domain-containing protein n=1 Tax=Stenotrophomonas sp. Y6 TaxID=2920383 RepID=UPI001F06CB04|nr:DUF4902 domain-containing protein [Stenotrophomonas sp. Y6]